MDNDEFFESMAETIGISVEDLLAAAQLNASRGVRLWIVTVLFALTMFLLAWKIAETRTTGDLL